MRHLRTMLFSTFFITGFSAQAQTKDEAPVLAGEWKVVSMKANRGQIPADQASKIKLSFTKNTVEITPAFAVKAEQKGVFVGKRGERKVTAR